MRIVDLSICLLGGCVFGFAFWASAIFLSADAGVATLILWLSTPAAALILADRIVFKSGQLNEAAEDKRSERSFGHRRKATGQKTLRVRRKEYRQNPVWRRDRFDDEQTPIVASLR